MRAALVEALARLELTLDDGSLDRLCRFGDALLEQNRVMNLTAITDPEAVARLHFADSLALLRWEDLRGKTVLDVGCGAGFPGVPLAIAVPEARVTLLDSLQKRVNWLKTVLPQLEVPADCVAARAEEYVAQHREQFDLVTSRAVARLNVLAELCLPYVRVGGRFLALKGAMAQEEADRGETCRRRPGRQTGRHPGVPRGRRRPPHRRGGKGPAHPGGLSPEICQNQQNPL